MTAASLALPPKIFGFTPSSWSAREIAEAIVARPRGATDGVGLVVTANIDHVAQLRHDPDFAAAYAAAKIVTCDGFPVKIYARLRGCEVDDRVTGCEIAAVLMRDCLFGAHHRLFFVVDCAATAAALHTWAATRGLGERTRIEVAPKDFVKQRLYCDALAWRIRAHGATILVMGVGAPRSEIFVNAQRAVLPACWALCVGQAVRIEVGLTRRAPPSWQGLNLEWLWRVLQEPRRLGRRYARSMTGFLGAVLADARRVARG